jgi:hypothetical protein
LHNFNYYPRLYYKSCTANSINFSERLKCIKQHYKNSINNIDIKCLPMLELFSFERIMIDEAHQIYDDFDASISSRKYIRNLLNNFTACYKWAVSGTPFTDFITFALTCRLINLNFIIDNINITMDDIFDNIPSANDFMSARNSSSNLSDIATDKMFQSSKYFVLNFIDKNYIIDDILQNICIRHIKEDVITQINIPKYKETIKWIEFTDIEKKIYDSFTYKRKSHTEMLQKLCCHILLPETNRKAVGCNNIVYIEDIRDKNVLFHKKNIKKYEEKLATLENT